MWSSRLFWRLFLCYSVLVVTGAVVLVLIFLGRQRASVAAEVQQRLRDEAVVTQRWAESAWEADEAPLEELRSAWQGRVEALGRDVGTRITLVRGDGVVLADSAADARGLENHADRPEVDEARRAGVGFATRRSESVREPFEYCALRVGTADRPRGFVRVALPWTAFERRLADTARRIWVTTAGLLLLALGVTYLLARRLIGPLESLTQAAQGIASGDLEQTVVVRSHDEVGALSQAFNSMSRELASRIEMLQLKTREAAEQSELLETVLGSMIEGVVVIDARQRILYANAAAGPLLDLPSDQVTGHSLFEAARHPRVQKVVEAVLRRSAERNSPHVSRGVSEGVRSGSTSLTIGKGVAERTELTDDSRFQAHRHALSDGQRVPPSDLRPDPPTRIEYEVPRTNAIVALIASPLPGDPPPGAVLVLHDVTELRRLENMRREFVSNVSHELKTPLTAIQTYAETLLDGAIDDAGINRPFVQRIEEQAERLHRLILDLLSLARIEAAEDAYELSPVSIADTVRICLAGHQTMAESKQIDLHAEPASEELCVWADEEGLRTVLDNLVDNAIKYTPSRGRVVIRWRLEGRRAVIEVADTGIGIPKQHHPRLFERFYRVDKARSRELGGTGLGLSIVKHWTQVFGGNVDVTSEPGRGSTFTVRVPVVS